MQSTYPQLTPELREAIAAGGGLPIQLEDPDTNKLYVLIEQPRDIALSDEYIRDQLSQGLAALSGANVSRGFRSASSKKDVGVSPLNYD